MEETGLKMIAGVFPNKLNLLDETEEEEKDGLPFFTVELIEHEYTLVGNKYVDRKRTIEPKDCNNEEFKTFENDEKFEYILKHAKCYSFDEDDYVSLEGHMLQKTPVVRYLKFVTKTCTHASWCYSLISIGQEVNKNYFGLLVSQDEYNERRFDTDKPFDTIVRNFALNMKNANKELHIKSINENEILRQDNIFDVGLSPQ